MELIVGDFYHIGVKGISSCKYRLDYVGELYVILTKLDGNKEEWQYKSFLLEFGWK